MFDGTRMGPDAWTQSSRATAVNFVHVRRDGFTLPRQLVSAIDVEEIPVSELGLNTSSQVDAPSDRRRFE